MIRGAVQRERPERESKGPWSVVRSHGWPRTVMRLQGVPRSLKVPSQHSFLHIAKCLPRTHSAQGHRTSQAGGPTARLPRSLSQSTQLACPLISGPQALPFRDCSTWKWRGRACLLECERQRSRRNLVSCSGSHHSSTFPSSVLLRKGHGVGRGVKKPVCGSNQEVGSRDTGQN